MLCLWAVPYGLGAGSVDAALNNYVALHYKSRHMSWLHCMWGVGATLGPVYYGVCSFRRSGMGCGIPVCGNHTDYVDGDSFFQPASLEGKMAEQKKKKEFQRSVL